MFLFQKKTLSKRIVVSVIERKKNVKLAREKLLGLDICQTFRSAYQTMVRIRGWACRGRTTFLFKIHPAPDTWLLGWQGLQGFSMKRTFNCHRLHSATKGRVSLRLHMEICSLHKCWNFKITSFPRRQRLLKYIQHSSDRFDIPE